LGSSTGTEMEDGMASADFHLGCDSLVRITPEVLNGPFGYLFEWSEHPSYPQVKVGSCELAADHDGRCEMFVDTTGVNTGNHQWHWLTWQGAGRSNQLPSAYEWLTAPVGCDAQSLNDYVCTRPAGHRGGHSFTTTTAPTP
jgi:hypothetical protein